MRFENILYFKIYQFVLITIFPQAMSQESNLTSLHMLSFIIKVHIIMDKLQRKR